MPKFRKFTIEELEKVHYTTLRALGREIGVKSPTSKAVSEIAKEIVDIQEGKLEPVKPTGKGAPPKDKDTVDLSKFYLTEDGNDEYPENTFDTVTVADHTNPITGEVVSEGILEMPSTSFGFLRVNNYENSKDDVYVPMQIIKEYNLRVGDKVKATAKLTQKTGSPAVQKVISINDLDPAEY